MNETPSRWQLFLVSFVSLFLEMTFLRWAPAQFRVLAYYSNLVLIACFLGLGLGCLLAPRKRDLSAFFPALLLGAIGAILAARGYQFHFTHGEGFQLWQTNVLEGGKVARDLDLKALLLGAFALSTLLFVPIGQLLGRALAPHPPLAGYAINILGSLAGVAAHAALSYFSLPPTLWFGVGAAAWLFALRARPGAILAGLPFLAAALFLLARDDRGFLWSPYYKIKLVSILPGQGIDSRFGFSLDVNEDYHQNAMNLSDAALQDPEIVSWQAWRVMYDAPYRYAEGRERVLILGAGTGNDVAAALRAGARRIDAVEIDPTIAELGRRHPEKPYADPRVTLHVDDARSFLRRATGPYDAVVFGFLDSHRLFSSMSSVRLDTYVYTVECLRRVRELLGPNGLASLSFCINQEWIARRLHKMLELAFGTPPAIVKGPDEIHLVFLAGPGLESRLPPTLLQAGDLPPCTDDWPYLYMQQRAIPEDYWFVIGAVALLAIVSVLAAAPSARSVEPHFFLLGAAFMLLETRSITVLALLFGSTWIVNAAVFTGILAAILGMTVLVDRVGFPRRLAYAGLAAALLASWLVPPSAFAGMGAAGTAAATALLSLPIFFAAGVFAVSFRETPDPTRALGSNLIGAVLGGFAEYASLVVGLANLIPIAAGLYALSALALRRGTASGPAAE